jgi:hypothetical protein
LKDKWALLYGLDACKRTRGTQEAVVSADIIQVSMFHQSSISVQMVRRNIHTFRNDLGSSWYRLRSLLARRPGQNVSKIIVFLSCTDSADYHWRLLGNLSTDGENAERADSDQDKSDS